MSELNRAELFSKLNPTSYQALEAATAFCKLRSHAYVELVHWVYHLLHSSNSDWSLIAEKMGLDNEVLQADIVMSLDRLPKGASAISDLSSHIDAAAQGAWVYGSLKMNATQIRSGHVLIAVLTDASLRSVLYGISSQFKRIHLEAVVSDFARLTEGSLENTASTPTALPSQSGQPQSALAAYGQNLTQKAKAGELDPVIGRDDEIRQLIDVLLRRRQNNPLLTGEAGVGKTAVVEGLAQRLASGDVPPVLQQVELHLLDIGLLQAGASVKGEFEKRLVQLIDEVQKSPVPIILFIDEIHTLIGAGGTEGTGDAANLLKPALARGQLRTIGATTWSEYKKHIEKDPALTRRFQLVQIDEPSAEKAQMMLRGVAEQLRDHHGVLILDEAIQSAVQLSQRYIPARQLPDKAVALLDTAAARVAISQHAKPAPLEQVERKRQQLQVELHLAEKEWRLGLGSEQRLMDLRQRLSEVDSERLVWETRWQQEHALIHKIVATQQQLCHSHDEEAAPALQNTLFALQDELFVLQNEQPLLFSVVDAAAVASVVADWTGIPVGRMLKDELDHVLQLSSHLGQRVIGQDHALTQIAQRIQSARARVLDPNKPIGVFMLCGPSGVGKTETALALADSLYGGEHNVITINMSEFQEAHTVSGLKGAPPGYVGYGEGGRLTEAVRRKPYSVVLLDEIEKAHPDVHELFFQVFDKGWMEDGEGRRVDFRNTVILLTSNVGTDEITHHYTKNPEIAVEALADQLRPALLQVFPPALLGRMAVIPYYPLDQNRLGRIAQLHWQRLARRVEANYATRLFLEDAGLALLLQRCAYEESGGRMIEAVINQHILPVLSQYLLTATLNDDLAAEIYVSAADHQFTFHFSKDNS